MAKTTLKLPSKMTRFASIETRATPPEDGVYTASFSSEEPVSRWFGMEILGHSSGEFDFSPLMNVGCVLVNHDPDQRVAVPLRAYVKDKRGYLDFKFPATEAALKAKAEVDAGLLRGISVGYSIDEMKLTKSTAEGEDEYRAVKWRAREVSLTPIPADTTVGVGRSAEAEEIEVAVIADDVVSRSIPVQETKIMDENKKESGTETTPAPTTPAAPAATAAPAERKTDIVKRDEAELANLAWCARELGVSGEDLLAASHSPRPMNEIIKGWRDAKGYKDDGKKHNRTPTTVGEDMSVKSLADSITGAILVRAGVATERGNLLYNGQPVKDKRNGGELLKTEFGPHSLRLSRFSIADMAREYVESAGIRTIGLTREEILAIAFGRDQTRSGMNTTGNFTVALENALNKTLLPGFMGEDFTWQEWVREVPITDLRAQLLYKPSGFGGLSRVNESGEVPAISMPDSKRESITAYQHGGTFNLTDAAIINDDMGFFNAIVAGMGRAGGETIESEVYYTYLSNPTMNETGGAMVNATVVTAAGGHANLTTGAGAPSATTYDALTQKMRLQKNLAGWAMNLRPDIVLTGPALEYTTRQLYVNNVLVGGNNNEQNLFSGAYRPVISALMQTGVTVRRAAGNLTASGTSTRWALINRQYSPIAIGFRAGRVPTFRSERPIGLFGTVYEAQLDFGVAAVEWRGVQQHNGA